MSQSVKHLTSRHNPIVQRYREVGRGRDHSAVLLDGTHLILEALTMSVALEHVLVSTTALDRNDVATLVKRLEEAGVEVATASTAVMAAASPVRSPSGLVALATRPAVRGDRLYGPRALVVIACDIQDPGNVGAIVRVAEAGGATAFVAAGASADPFGWKALRGSMGSALRFPIARAADSVQAVAEARAQHCRVVATVPRDGTPIFDADLRAPLAILIGGEGAGLSELLLDLADERITVPMQPPVESLNAAVTAALVVYEARRHKPAVRR